MKRNKFINFFLEKFSIAYGEFMVVLTLVIGLVVGTVYNNSFRDKIDYAIPVSKSDALFRTLDSIAEINKTTFVGSNMENEPIPELVAKDTVVPKVREKKNDFQGAVNINTASKSRLMRLHGIGEKMADRIIEYRSQTPFTKKEDIMNVKGIGPKIFEKMKDNITVQ